MLSDPYDYMQCHDVVRSIGDIRSSFALLIYRMIWQNKKLELLS